MAGCAPEIKMHQSKYYGANGSQYKLRSSFRGYTINTVTCLLIGFAIYFVIYLYVRDPFDSSIPCPAIIVAIVVCPLFALYLQWRRCVEEKQDSASARLRHHQGINTIFSTTRRSRIHSAAQLTSQQSLSGHKFTPYGQYYERPSLGAVLRKGEILYDSRTQFGAVKETSPRLPLPEIPVETKGEKELLGAARKTAKYQGDARDYEEISSNRLALDQYEKMGIRSKLPRWVETIRYWVGNTFVPTLLTRHQQNLEQLAKVLSYYDRRLVFARVEDHYANNVDPVLWEDLCDVVGGQGSFPLRLNGRLSSHMLNDEQLKSSLRKLVQERDNLERYFRLKENSLAKRDYVIERLKRLQSNFIAEYNNNGGMEWGGEPWNSSLPKDSDLISWLFFRMVMQFSFSQGSKYVELTNQFYSVFPDYPRKVW